VFGGIDAGTPSRAKTTAPPRKQAAPSWAEYLWSRRQIGGVLPPRPHNLLQSIDGAVLLETSALKSSLAAPAVLSARKSLRLCAVDFFTRSLHGTLHVKWSNRSNTVVANTKTALPIAARDIMGNVAIWSDAEGRLRRRLEEAILVTAALAPTALGSTPGP
jgi:hypothetical protein